MMPGIPVPCAMHLLQAGIDMAVIALWLGHESIEVKFQQRYQMRHRKSRDEDALWGFNSAISICRRSWKRSRIPRAARRFWTRWPTARRLPGGTSTCSASMISRQKSCGTASGSGSQNWGAKKEVFLDLIQTDKPQCTERIR